WQTNMLLGLGIMLSASEVSRIAQQFGLDTSIRFNMVSVSSTVNTAMRAGKFVTSKLA
ncbi:conjugal transfer protein TrbL family protein, partial [Porcipelethomonas sp.]|uniref:conjugal transfer protein TrbL family protein n=1 Tax=Porcipelethomonas sp. TaxID=2981675 RepID=UPI003078B4AD